MQNARSETYLMSFGLDPYVISAGDWNDEGYFEFQLDSEGNRKLDPEAREVVKEWREWPPGFNPDRLLTHYLNDLTDYQRRGRARRNYYVTLLGIEWGSKSPREIKRLRRKEPLLVEAIEGILKYDRP